MLAIGLPRTEGSGSPTLSYKDVGQHSGKKANGGRVCVQRLFIHKENGVRKLYHTQKGNDGGPARERQAVTLSQLHLPFNHVFVKPDL